MPTPTPLALRTLQLASTQVGVLEDPIGSNDGAAVRNYLAVVHLPPGKSWCAAFVCWCVGGAATDLGIAHALKFSGSALHLYDLNLDLQFTTLTADDLPCIAIFDEGQGLGHVVIACGLSDDGLIDVVAGNTNNSGGRQGIGCFALQGRYAVTDPRIKGYLRIA